MFQLIASLFHRPAPKNYMLSSSYPKPSMVTVNDKTVVMSVSVYNPNDITAFVESTNLPDTTKHAICEIVTDDDHFKTYSPDKFNVHFTNKTMDSLLCITNATALPDVCLAVVVE